MRACAQRFNARVGVDRRSTAPPFSSAEKTPLVRASSSPFVFALHRSVFSRSFSRRCARCARIQRFPRLPVSALPSRLLPRPLSALFPPRPRSYAPCRVEGKKAREEKKEVAMLLAGHWATWTCLKTRVRGMANPNRGLRKKHHARVGMAPALKVCQGRRARGSRGRDGRRGATGGGKGSRTG